MTRPDALSDASVARVFERYRRERDPRDLETLTLRFLPLARSLARKYDGGSEREDLEQVAYMGLIKAIDRFDPDRGIAFTSFAVPTILGELKRHFRDKGWSVRVPRSLQELAARVDAAAEALVGELGRSPTPNEIAARCRASVEDVLEALATRTAHRPDSLDRPVGDEEDGTVLSVIGGDEPGYARVEHDVDLALLLEALPEREREVLRLRFEQDLVQREIAARVGISQMHVSRVLTHAIKLLRAEAAVSR